MGTDIHGRLQMKNHRGDYIDIGPIEDDRNYRVFAMLADVRNGFGFAGVKTHEPLVPISEPRGLPNPLGSKGERYDETSNRFVPVPYDADEYFGDHSFSWVTLKEVADWPGWDKPLAMTGIISAEEFQRIERTGDTPREWSGGKSGRNVVIVNAADAHKGVPHTDVEYEWQVPFRFYAKQFRAWIDYLVLKYGWKLADDPAAVRLVFGFDS